ncbi:MAG: cytochrome b/b6 domain-containing protein [Rhodocyclaceae bacterium]|nr:cytochrome b/b6 domain-containing protein [Rhodocyclaceae bacterium]
MQQRILVWDLPVRIGHWLMASSFLVAWLTAESEDWHTLHLAAGGTLLGVVIFRILWGLIGTRYARFAEFIRRPREIGQYLRALLRLDPPTFIGHNPAGGVAILVMLGLGALTALLGWGAELEWGGDWLKDVHEFAASLMLAVVCVHIGGVVLDSVLHRFNLARAMVDGRKQGAVTAGIASAKALGLIPLFACIGVVLWYLLR